MSFKMPIVPTERQTVNRTIMAGTPENIALGFWYDYSLNGLFAARLTLSIRGASFLITGLSTLVTFAGASLWATFAYSMHVLQARKSHQDGLDVLQRVLLRNPGSPLEVAWATFQIHGAWHKTASRAACRLLQIAIPALLLWLGVIIAGVFVAEIASPSHKGVHVLLKNENCGFYPVSRDVKLRKEAREARNYATNWYNKTEVVATGAHYAVQSLPFTMSDSEPCPFTESGISRCLDTKNNKSGRQITNLSFSFDTGRLDSHAMFGVNAPRKDRVELRRRATCSPIIVRSSDFQQYNGTSYTCPRKGPGCPFAGQNQFSYFEFYFGEITGKNSTQNFTNSHDNASAYVTLDYRIEYETLSPLQDPTGI